VPYWQQRIAPELSRGRRVLIVSHKNALRALVKLLDRRADADVRRIRVPTGVPIVFTLDGSLAVLERRVLDGTGGALAPAVATAR
jgi:2,3-bisphosphoglycerate-dependent phosphoglycerate mutase